MRVLLVLAALGWIISLPWATLFGYLALLFIAIAMLWSISVSIERRNISPRPKSRIIDSNYVTALEAMVAEAETQVEALRAEMDRLRAAMAASKPDPRTALYGRVGLHADAPDWLIAAARRAYRVALHPDRHPVHHKAAAEHRFKEADAIFERIAGLG